MPWYESITKEDSVFVANIPNLLERPTLAVDEDGYELKYEDLTYGVRLYVHPKTHQRRMFFQLANDDDGIYWEEYFETFRPGG